MNNLISKAVQEAVSSTPLFKESKTVSDLNQKLCKAYSDLQETKNDLFQIQKEMSGTESKVKQLLMMRKAGVLGKTDSEILEDLFQRVVIEKESIFKIIGSLHQNQA